MVLNSQILFKTLHLHSNRLGKCLTLVLTAQNCQMERWVFTLFYDKAFIAKKKKKGFNGS